MLRRFCIRWNGVALVCAITLGFAAIASAQIEVLEVNYEGAVAEVRPNAILLKATNGEIVLAEIDPVRKLDAGRILNGVPEPKVEIQGDESVDFLQPGMYVRFQATVELKRRVSDELTEVDVIGRDKDTVFGFLDPAGPLAAGEGDAEKPKAASADYLVVGQVKSMRRNIMTVAVPDGASVKNLGVRLADDAVVKLRSSDLRLIRPGDQIRVTTWMIAEVIPAKHFATQVTITRVKDPKKPELVAKADDKPAKGDAENPFDVGKGEPKEDKPDRPKYKGKILKIN